MTVPPFEPGASPLMTRRPDDTMREQVVRVLSDAYAQGRLTMEELEARMEAVYRSSTVDGLQALVADVTAGPDGAHAPYAVHAAQSVRSLLSSVSGGRMSVVSRIVRVDARFGSVDNTSLDYMPQRLELSSTFGSIELDLRHTTFPPGVTEIDVSAFFGSIELLMPLHVTVDNQVTTVLGSAEVKERKRRGPPAATLPIVRGPVYVRLVGTATFGSVEVKQMPL